MAIKYTNSHTKKITAKYEGCVIEVRSFVSRRNMSDTLDYTDFRDVECMEALVYEGRVTNAWDAVEGKYVERPALPLERFAWVDCSNHFTWRGADLAIAEVDAFPFGVVQNPEMLEDYGLYLTAKDEQTQKRVEAQAAADLVEQARKAQEEKDRPVKGKRMVVFRGRKVPVGYAGTVAFITASGNVLLKKHDQWQDRKADGVWVMKHNLKAV